MNYTQLAQAIQDYSENTESLFVANIPRFVMETEEKPVQNPKKRRTQEEKTGRIKYTLQLVKQIQADIAGTIRTNIMGTQAAYFRERGYEILEANYRSPYGEIDLIARHKDYLVFIEVRTKKSLEFGSPEESITAVKRERMKAAAYHYEQAHDNLPPSWRIDVMAVELGDRGKPSRIELIENAVGE
jgi:putative endonuclease